MIFTIFSAAGLSVRREDADMAKLGIFSWFSYPMPIEARFRLIREAGFEATALWWGDEDDGDKQVQPELARKHGLELDYIHAPFDDPNLLWAEGIDGEEYVKLLTDCMEDCARHEIPTLAAHITRLSARPAVTEIGMERIKRLTEHAERTRVKLALENMNCIPHLERIFTEVKSEYLGFCYDSGHEHCNHPDANCLGRWGKRLFAVHLGDNLGEDDTHLLPYDGSIDWEVLREKLRVYAPRTLMLEADFNRRQKSSALYYDLTAAEFLARAYERAMKINF